MSLEEKFIVKQNGQERTRTLTVGAALVHVHNNAENLDTWAIEPITKATDQGKETDKE